MKMPKKVVSLSARQWQWLHDEAARTGLSVSEVMRRALDEHIETREVSAERKNPARG